MTIWKFPLDLFEAAGSSEASLHVSMPEGARVLYVGTQNNRPTFWAQVDETAATELRKFYVVGTGHPIPEGARYLGSAMTHEGVYVWHFYEPAGLAESLPPDYWETAA